MKFVLIIIGLKRLALKVLNTAKIDEADFSAYQEELKFLESNPNRFVVNYVECFKDNFTPHIVTKYYKVNK